MASEVEKADWPDQSAKLGAGCLQGQLDKSGLYPFGRRETSEGFLCVCNMI